MFWDDSEMVAKTASGAKQKVPTNFPYLLSISE